MKVFMCFFFYKLCFWDSFMYWVWIFFLLYCSIIHYMTLPQFIYHQHLVSCKGKLLITILYSLWGAFHWLSIGALICQTLPLYTFHFTLSHSLFLILELSLGSWNTLNLLLFAVAPLKNTWIPRYFVIPDSFWFKYSPSLLSSL